FEIDSLEELEGLRVPLVWKDPSQREEWVKALKEQGSIASMEAEMVSASGRTIWLLASGLLMTYQGQPAILSIHNEITERKLREDTVKDSERWFRTLADTTTTGIFIYQDDRYVYANAAITRITGYSEREFLQLEHVWDLVHPDFRDTVRERTVARQAGEDVPEHYELKIVCRDGEEKWLDISVGVIDWGGRPAAIGTAFDITGRKQALEQVNALLQEKEVILKETHHRVKNNMNVIASLLTLQSDDVPSDECKDIILDAAGRAHSMMVLYDKLYRSNEVRELDLKEYLEPMVQEILTPFFSAFSVKAELHIENIELATKTLSSLGIIMNELITNSMKYAFAGRREGTIAVDAFRSDNGVTIVYRDDGVGMPPDVDFDTQTTFGLQLIRLLSRQIGAEVEVKRENGTVFTFSIPDSG
ncbi:MAG: PAS domain S-box protein, partial [Spirochaetales bacterium]|nr:PAS domain S-box protein [Spirochaetales bacterium]MCF7938098.1 PAS domain S-box protein [Spirochaetales bacterium]